MKRDSNGKPAKKVAAKNPRRSSDPNVLAHQLIREMTDKLEVPTRVTPAEVSRVMAAMGRKGGKLGGVARAAKMTPEQRREVALKAARARWDKS